MQLLLFDGGGVVQTALVNGKRRTATLLTAVTRHLCAVVSSHLAPRLSTFPTLTALFTPDPNRRVDVADTVSAASLLSSTAELNAVGVAATPQLFGAVSRCADALRGLPSVSRTIAELRRDDAVFLRPVTALAGAVTRLADGASFDVKRQLWMAATCTASGATARHPAHEQHGSSSVTSAADGDGGDNGDGSSSLVGAMTALLTALGGAMSQRLQAYGVVYGSARVFSGGPVWGLRVYLLLYSGWAWCSGCPGYVWSCALWSVA